MINLYCFFFFASIGCGMTPAIPLMNLVASLLSSPRAFVIPARFRSHHTSSAALLLSFPHYLANRSRVRLSWKVLPQRRAQEASSRFVSNLVHKCWLQRFNSFSFDVHVPCLFPYSQLHSSPLLPTRMNFTDVARSLVKADGERSVLL